MVDNVPARYPLLECGASPERHLALFPGDPVKQVFRFDLRKSLPNRRWQVKVMAVRSGDRRLAERDYTVDNRLPKRETLYVIELLARASDLASGNREA